MPSGFEERFQALASPGLQNRFGVTVTITRGVNVSAGFTARRHDRTFGAMGAEYGIEIKITMRDFILPIASVVIGGNTVEPRTGDRITEGDEIFEIQPPDDKKPSVELQPGGFNWLVHTKRVE